MEEGLLTEALRDILTEEVKRSWRFRSVKKPGMVYREKPVKVNSKRHLNMLQRTYDHLQALKACYAPSSSTRHILSQACVRIKRLLKQLEKTGLENP